MGGKWLSFGLVGLALVGVAVLLLGPELGWFGGPDDDGTPARGIESADGLEGDGDAAPGGAHEGPQLVGIGRLLVGEGDVIGRVLDVETREPVVAVDVVLRGRCHEGRTVEVKAVTGTDGRFHLARVPAGHAYKMNLVVEGTTVQRTSAVDVKARDVTDLRILWIGEQAGLRGTVFGPGDTPVSGAVVELHPGGTLDMESMLTEMTRLLSTLDRDPEPTAQVESDVDGSFAFKGLEPGLVTLVVRHEGHGLAVKQIAVTAVANAPPVRVVLEPIEPIVGRVISEARVPIRGARVALVDQADQETGWYTREFVETESDGRFTITSPPRAPRLMAIVTAEDYPMAMAEVKAGDGTNEIVLHGGAELEVRLLEQGTDRPIEGAQIVAIMTATRTMSGRDGTLVTGLTDESGLVALPARVGHVATLWFQHPERGMNMFVPQMQGMQAIASGMMQGPKDLSIKAGRNEAVFRVPNGRTIRGTVKDEDGNPLQGATVSSGGMGGGSRKVVTDADGAYELRGVPRVPMMGMVRAKLPGYVMVTDPNDMMGMLGMGGDDDKPQDIVMKRAATVTGRVLRADGTPIVSARVRLVPKENGMGFNPMGQVGGEESFTDGRGQYRIDSAVSGTKYNVVARAEGFLDGPSETFTTKDGGTTSVPAITLLAGHALRIEVEDPDGRALAGARVEVQIEVDEEQPQFSMFDRFRSRFRGVTDAAGDATLRDLPLGKATITVRHQDHANTVAEHVLEPAGTKGGVVVRLTRALKAEGRVVDPDGKPVADVFVQPRVEGTDAPPPNGTSTDARGRFEIPGVPVDGTLWLHVSGRGWKPTRFRPVGSLESIEITLEPLGKDTQQRIESLEAEMQSVMMELGSAKDDEERQQIGERMQRIQEELGSLRGAAGPMPIVPDEPLVEPAEPTEVPDDG